MPIHLRTLRLTSTTFAISLLACASACSQVKAQGADVPVDVREQKEARAPQVMASGVPSISPLGSSALDEATELEALQETQKRLSKLEKSDPAQALAEYKKFWQGHIPHPGIAIQVALKIVELRLQLKDARGALLTCETMLTKYVSNPASVELALRKALILVSQDRFDEAAGVVDVALPRLLALGPQSYGRTSELLLSMGQRSTETGGERGKWAASEFYQGVEQVYLRWLEAGMVSHTWQMFEVLQDKYQQAGDGRRAGELLPKAADALLRIEPTEKNPEGGDASIMAARWLMNRGFIKEAQALYIKVPAYKNGFVTQVAAFDQGRELLNNGRYEEGRKMLHSLLPTVSKTGELRAALLMVLVRSYSGTKEFDPARRYAAEVIAIAETDPNSGVELFADEARTVIAAMERWKQSPILCEPQGLTIEVQASQLNARPIIRRLTVRTLQDVPLEAKVDSAQGTAFKVRIVEKSTWISDQSQASRAAASDVGVEKDVVVEIIKPSDLRAGKATLILSSPLLNGARTSVPMQVVIK